MRDLRIGDEGMRRPDWPRPLGLLDWRTGQQGVGNPRPRTDCRPVG